MNDTGRYVWSTCWLVQTSALWLMVYMNVLSVGTLPAVPLLHWIGTACVRVINAMLGLLSHCTKSGLMHAQVPQRYKLPAQEIIDVALQAVPSVPAQQAPFRPVDFKWTVARLAMSLLTGLASSGPAGAAWAAKAGSDIAALMAQTPVLQRVLR